ncbi:MAG: FliA/WhiG family RNA polymerase sigma factor, partial [Proteobacteria bacterium]|nr:FliA/WhiG family RNA polymerase sigma factor [Pseudomonadota bacterium]
ALDKFDSEKGAAFRTYAYLRIKGAILDELRKMDWVSRSVRRDIHKIEDARRALEMKFGRDPDDSEVAEELEIDIDSYYKMTARAQGAGLFSLDGIILDGFAAKFTSQTSDASSPMAELDLKELKLTMAKALAKLSDKEQLIMSLYYYDELTLKEISRVLDLTESRICQIHSKAIIKLRLKLKSYHED